jgi:hypothetical protein
MDDYTIKRKREQKLYKNVNSLFKTVMGDDFQSWLQCHNGWHESGQAFFSMTAGSPNYKSYYTNRYRHIFHCIADALYPWHEHVIPFFSTNLPFNKHVMADNGSIVGVIREIIKQYLLTYKEEATPVLMCFSKGDNGYTRYCEMLFNNIIIKYCECFNF